MGVTPSEAKLEQLCGGSQTSEVQAVEVPRHKPFPSRVSHGRVAGAIQTLGRRVAETSKHQRNRKFEARAVTKTLGDHALSEWRDVPMRDGDSATQVASSDAIFAGSATEVGQTTTALTNAA